MPTWRETVGAPGPLDEATGTTGRPSDGGPLSTPGAGRAVPSPGHGGARVTHRGQVAMAWLAVALLTAVGLFMMARWDKGPFNFGHARSPVYQVWPRHCHNWQRFEVGGVWLCEQSPYPGPGLNP